MENTGDTGDMDDKRQLKAIALLESGVMPVAVGMSPHKWIVGSERDPQTSYVVEDAGGMWLCECPDFCYRGGLCKHILLVRLFLKSLDLTDLSTPLVKDGGSTAPLQ
jgi:hypothetical protein